MKKKAFAEDINGIRKWYCEYKNCRRFVFENYIVCKKHIGQTRRDFLRNHIIMDGMIIKADKETARIFNKII